MVSATTSLPETPGEARGQSGILKANLHREISQEAPQAPCTNQSSDRDHCAVVAHHDAQMKDLRRTASEWQATCDTGLDEAAAKLAHIEINGEKLTMAEVIAVARHNAKVRITKDRKCLHRISQSISWLAQHLEEGNIVYGINTGYGGSADTRSADLISMQQASIQHHNAAVLLSSDKHNGSMHGQLQHLKPHCLPRSIVRASMLTRCNSLMRGHSAVRQQVIENIVKLLNRDFIPIVPLRGSISASGDLTPLAYIAGALEGNPDIFLDCRLESGLRQVRDATDALYRAEISPIVLMPKEGLGLMNGTAVSAAAASLALHETNYLALASQVLTGMATEALGGSLDNFHPFVSKARPHPGQQEVARNILRQLRGSKLVVSKDARTAGLYQDRYALRTSPQWIGPQLEDLLLAQRQVDVELNSTTDNPLIDVEAGSVHHGGNFQAVAITSAMEKSRLVLQMLGKLIFAQSSEMINPMLNNNLSPNLCFDDPDVSFTFKGVDINMAAYMSELAFLANPVSSHVQSAEMHNQAVNSLALISGRYTMDTVELVSLMVATDLYVVCQALDLNVLYIEYLNLIMVSARGIFDRLFGSTLASEAIDKCWIEISESIRKGLAQSKSKTTLERSRVTAEATVAPLFAYMSDASNNDPTPLSLVKTWVDQLASTIDSSIGSTRARFEAKGPTTLNYLGAGSKVMYRHVREALCVPLHLGLVEHPPYIPPKGEEMRLCGRRKTTIGSQIGVIYEALRSDDMGHMFVEALSGA